MGEHTEAHAAAGHAPVWHTSVWPMILSVGILFFAPLGFRGVFCVQKFHALVHIPRHRGSAHDYIHRGLGKEGMTDEHGYREGA